MKNRSHTKPATRPTTATAPASSRRTTTAAPSVDAPIPFKPTAKFTPIPRAVHETGESRARRDRRGYLTPAMDRPAVQDVSSEHWVEILASLRSMFLWLNDAASAVNPPHPYFQCISLSVHNLLRSIEESDDEVAFLATLATLNESQARAWVLQRIYPERKGARVAS